MPSSTAVRWGERRSGKPAAATPNPVHSVNRVPMNRTSDPASNVVTMDGKNTKDANPSCIGPTRQRRPRQDEIHEGEGPDEGEQNAKSNAESRTQPWIAQMLNPRIEEGVRRDSHLHHRSRLGDREVNERSASQIHSGEEVEVGCQTEVVGDRGRDQAADEVARDVSGYVGRESTIRIAVAALLPEVSEHESECGRHEQPLRDAEHREHGQIRSNRQERGRNRRVQRG